MILVVEIGSGLQPVQPRERKVWCIEGDSGEERPQPKEKFVIDCTFEKTLTATGVYSTANTDINIRINRRVQASATDASSKSV